MIAKSSKSANTDKSDKAARKAALKKEAEKMGISYDDLKAKKKEEKSNKKSKKERKRKLSESEILQSDSFVRQANTENKRMRSYSKDFEEERGKTENDTDGKFSPSSKNTQQQRRRTRSMDAAEAASEQEKSNDNKKSDSLSVGEWRKEHQLRVSKPSVNFQDFTPLDPYLTFKQTPFCADIQKAISHAGYTSPTVIQAQAWPIAIAGEDMISIAKTGSGKTCGFLLPCLHLYLTQLKKTFNPAHGPMMLVLAPTRELAQQISEETAKFGRATRVRSVCCYGGAPKYPQIQTLKRGVEIVIATPGRLNDLLDARAATLKNCQFLVLDEADRMLDMGFEPQIRSILSHMKDQKRQTLLFSATWPKEVEQLAHEFLTDPVRINVGQANVLNANKDILQKIELVQDAEKFDKLKGILDELVKQGDDDDDSHKNGNKARLANEKAHAKAIIFTAKKASCDQLANHLWDEGYAVDSLHGDRAQWERTKVTNAFKSGTLRLLIATDVAARGLDVKDVGVVVNYDMPAGSNGVEDYVHRIGRTGRAGRKGKAFTFFTRGDSKNATKLVQVLNRAEQEVPDWLQAMARPRGYGGGRGRFGRGGGRGGRSYMSGRSGGRSYMSGRGGRGRGRGGYRR